MIEGVYEAILRIPDIDLEMTEFRTCMSDLYRVVINRILKRTNSSFPPKLFAECQYLFVYRYF